MRREPSKHMVAFDDGAVATLHSDREGNEWIIIQSADYPEYEGEITEGDDPPLFHFFKRMIQAYE